MYISDCLNLTQPENGNVIYLNLSTSYKAVAKIKCNEGFRLEGNSMQTCLANGSWSGHVLGCNKTGECNFYITKTFLFTRIIKWVLHFLRPVFICLVPRRGGRCKGDNCKVNELIVKTEG